MARAKNGDREIRNGKDISEDQSKKKHQISIFICKYI